MSNKANNATFTLLAAGNFLNAAINAATNYVSPRLEEVQRYKIIARQSKVVAKQFGELKALSNAQEARTLSRATKVMEVRNEKAGREYSEESDLTEGYQDAAGDMYEFMQVWLKHSHAGTLDLLRSNLKQL